ncbi:hypothetical protein LSUE1_G008574 [Lachnellula suecica]|uniref:Uncharacterized protein n=1 Tax=Lachnellula suecica TaxID=602035 RepID=A0A8T9BYP9_9HELO|nr:hypothetical protein LSUE1_G008574 [Lachnellula suecica]
MNSRLGHLGLLIALSVAFYTTQLWLWLTKFPCISTTLFGLLGLAATLGTWHLVDNGNTLESHGSYNLLIFCLMFTPINLIVAILCVCYKFIDGKGHVERVKRLCQGLFVFSLTLGVILFIVTRIIKRDSNYGFFQETIPCSPQDRENGLCDACQWEETTPWFDLLPFRQNFFTGSMSCPVDDSFSATLDDGVLSIEGCNTGGLHDVSHLTSLAPGTSNGPSYSYLPQTEKWGLRLKNDSLGRKYNGFQESVLDFFSEHTYPYIGPVSIDEEIDSVLVHCNSRPPKLVYRIRPVHAEPGPTERDIGLGSPQGLNVVTLFIDAMSRNHFHRRLPRTREALEKLTGMETSESSLYELFRYHSVGTNTTPNTRAPWAGLNESDAGTSGTPIWEEFEDAGYVSARIDPMCQDWSAYYNSASFPDGDFIDPRISHEHIAFSCIPPTVPVGKDNSGNFAGPASIKSRCFSDTHVGWHILDWASKFVDTYQGNRRFFLNAAFMESHEGSGEVLQTLDSRLESFFNVETSPSDWNTTAVLIVSDHGALMGLNNAFFHNGKVEAKNPFAAFVMPRWYMEMEERNERLTEAKGELVTPHDIYETLQGLKIGGSSRMENQRGKDLMKA